MADKIIFLGNNEKSLGTLLKGGFKITAAIYENAHDLAHTGVHDDAIRCLGGKVIEVPKDDCSCLWETLKTLERPDLIVVSIFTILSQEILDFPVLGCLNIHPGLLPFYKGPHPIQWVLMNGEPYTGVTFMKLDRGVDSGGVYQGVKIPITDEDDSLTLAKKMDEAVDLHLSDIVKGVLERKLIANPQEAFGSYFPKLQANNRFINFRKMTARDIHNLTRSQVKYGGSMTTLRFKRIEFATSRIIEETSVSENGGEIQEVRRLSNSGISVVVKCVQGSLELSSKDPLAQGIIVKDWLGS